jgi:endonuclease/exonuclease/phosphatase family metal-dependent hydrolase
MRLSLVSWNLGYGGLGEGSDFFKDLGESSRPPSPEAVDRNIAAIREKVGSMEADIFLFQEMARPSYVNYRRDLLDPISEALGDMSVVYAGDFRTRLVPPPWSVSVGNASFVRPSAEIDRIVLDGYRERFYGVAVRDYTLHRVRLSDAPWTVFNLHLSAFDAEEENKREQQAREVIALAEAEYRAGRCVVLGGDWNMRLVPTNFPHTTDARFQFWIRDVVPNLLPDGWRWAIDRTAPTVRTLHKPYVAGENYTTIVDGWAVSPNVRVLEVETEGLGFRNSDHNPLSLAVECLGELDRV